MGARTGQDYIDRLASLGTTVHIGGETLQGGIPDHPAFRNLVRTYARLYDLQHAPEHRDTMLYPSPTTGDPVGTSFMVPRTHEDLAKRRAAFKVWADESLGTLGRTGDYLNSSLMALSEAGEWFAQADPAFAENVRRYYEMVREQDLLMTHTLIPPQANRSQAAAAQMGGRLTAHIVDEDDNGIVVRGARLLATIGPTADELLVFPSTVLKGRPEDAPYAFAFAINCDAPGLRFICRESMDYGRSRFDHPLGSRFEEMDAVVIFDDVHVPYERCFMLRNPELCNGFYTETSAVVHMTHQVTTRTMAKTEFLLGLISCITEAIGIEQFPNVQADVAEVIVALEQSRAREKIMFTLYYLLFRYGRPTKSGNYVIELGLTHSIIASLVGLTRETTTTELSKLKRQKVVDYNLHSYVVNKQKLERLLGEDSFQDVIIR